jgi:hypothetical protein
VRIGGLEVVQDLEPAAWLVAQLQSWAPDPATLASFLPAGFDGYVRILHPAYRIAPDGLWQPVHWRDLPQRLGPIGAETGFCELTGWRPHEPSPGGVDREPDDGTMNAADLQTVAAFMSGWTTTPDDVWFCVWAGYGWPELPRVDDRNHLVQLPHRDHWLCHGTMADALQLPHGQAPTLWWPNDKAWCISTEIDGYSTFVAATARCVDTLLALPELETVETHLTASIAAY